MDEAAIQRQILERHGLRIEPEMGNYIFRKLTERKPADASSAIPVIGIDAKTGIPLTRMLDLGTLDRSGQ